MNGLREINLELGHPAAADAVRRLSEELALAKRQQCAAVKIIHGYGSSGRGGRIRTECRRRLGAMAEAGQVRRVLPGETFSIFDEATRQAFACCPTLRADRDLDRYNQGVTYVVL